ncbi:Lnb N-terminal periplasmic domain-containing protein [Variovorax boronicumulans]|uniref:Lnb N-terminal periplasmic domain-containing protein n=1 Tax=Variovorax boronicumulans TaxID=436515 RepID=UPI003392528A
MTPNFLHLAGRLLATLALLLSSAWAATALWYQVPGPAALKIAAAVLWACFGLAAIALLWRGKAARPLLSYIVGFALLLSWWGTIQPSQNRVWADDVAQQLVAKVDGRMVTMQNVRNFDWRSDTDRTVRWETRQYDLDRIRSVDVALSHWTGPAIAHTLVSFGFDDGRFLTFSIEIRKERGESFSSIGGFFKQFETSLVAADERDILRVRTNVRGEDVYMYRVQLPQAQMRSLFLAYLGEADALVRAPSFYNTLFANCTTIVYELAKRVVPGLPMDYRLLASGYLPDYLYDVGGLAPGFSLEALRTGGRITDRAQAFDKNPGAEDFSQAIRRGMPGVAP